jgi:hypothetical protein
MTRGLRGDELPTGRVGSNQERRGHNKHNHDEQAGHEPQEPTPSQEKK